MEDIGKLGMKIVNGKGNEMIIMLEDFKHFDKARTELVAL